MPIAPRWQTENRTPRILIVDDDFEIADPVKFALQKLGYEVTHAPDGNQGVAAIPVVNPDLMVLGHDDARAKRIPGPRTFADAPTEWRSSHHGDRQRRGKASDVRSHAGRR